MHRLSCSLIEVKADGADGDMTFTGYGSVFGNVDLGGDMVMPGAFTAAIEQAKKSGIWPALLMQHGMEASGGVPVGIYTDMKEDDVGLWLQAKLAATPRGEEAYTLMKMTPRPAISGLSIGYIPKSWEWTDKDGKRVRLLKQVDLMEVSLVTFPMNGLARVNSVKSALTQRDAERALQFAGFSETDALAIVAKGFSAMSEPSADDHGELTALLKSSIATLTCN